jgi:hypothetical protein
MSRHAPVFLLKEEYAVRTDHIDLLRSAVPDTATMRNCFRLPPVREKWLLTMKKFRAQKSPAIGLGLQEKRT